MTPPNTYGRAILVGVLLSFVCVILLLTGTAIFGTQVPIKGTTSAPRFHHHSSNVGTHCLLPNEVNEAGEGRAAFPHAQSHAAAREHRHPSPRLPIPAGVSPATPPAMEMCKAAMELRPHTFPQQRPKCLQAARTAPCVKPRVPRPVGVGLRPGR